MVYNLDRSAFAAGGIGVGTGGLQLIVTRVLDIKGSLGANLVAHITNGQLLNVGSGIVMTLLGLIGCFGKTRLLGGHPGFSAWLLGHGMTTLVAGGIAPLVAGAITGTNSYAASIGSYPPPQRSNPLSAGAPLATQRNAQLIRALRG